MLLGRDNVSITLVETMPGLANLVDQTLSAFAVKFGGATVQEQTGAWVMSDGTLCKEKGVKVWAFTGGDTEADTWITKYAHKLAVSTSQEAVLYTLSDGSGVLAEGTRALEVA